MVLASFREGWGMIRRFPLLLMLGFMAGLLGAGTLVVQFYAGMFFSERVGVIQLLVVPFFIGGAFQLIQTQEGSSSIFWTGGRRFYLRILLATVVILFTSLLTMLAVVVPLAILGIFTDPSVFSLILFGVLIPMVYFTLFYDAAIVFEDRKVLDSIRRSVEFVLMQGFSVFLFIMVNILVVIGIALVFLVFWSLALAPQLEPLATSITLGQTITPETLVAVLGPHGILVTAVLYIIGVTISVTFFYAYKACFFRRYSSSAIPVVGEFDEKGRWYKY